MDSSERGVIYGGHYRKITHLAPVGPLAVDINRTMRVLPSITTPMGPMLPTVCPRPFLKLLWARARPRAVPTKHRAQSLLVDG